MFCLGLISLYYSIWFHWLQNVKNKEPPEELTLQYTINYYNVLKLRLILLTDRCSFGCRWRMDFSKIGNLKKILWRYWKIYNLSLLFFTYDYYSESEIHDNFTIHLSRFSIKTWKPVCLVNVQFCNIQTTIIIYNMIYKTWWYVFQISLEIL